MKTKHGEEVLDFGGPRPNGDATCSSIFFRPNAIIILWFLVGPGQIWSTYEDEWFLGLVARGLGGEMSWLGV